MKAAKSLRYNRKLQPLLHFLTARCSLACPSTPFKQVPSLDNFS